MKVDNDKESKNFSCFLCFQVAEILVDSPLDNISFFSGSSEKIKILTDSFFKTFDNSFKAMNEETKWKLRCSERVVEDVLYTFGADQEREK